jgi:hypothetical protein
MLNYVLRHDVARDVEVQCDALFNHRIKRGVWIASHHGRSNPQKKRLDTYWAADGTAQWLRGKSMLLAEIELRSSNS